MSLSAHNRYFGSREHVYSDSMKFNQRDGVHLINAIMAGLSAEEAQRTPELQKYTTNEIRSAYREYIHNPPKSIASPESLSTSPPFSLEEDFHILGFKHLLATGSSEIDLVREFTGKIPINRTAEEIYRRLGELAESDTERIIDEYAKQLISQEDGVDTPLAVDEDELNRLERHFHIVASSKFARDAIAMFAGSNAVYYMCFRTVTIGIGAKVMVNLANFESGVPQERLRGFDSVVTFLCDGRFVMENKGWREFRVNGTLVSPGQYTVLENRAMLDFNDVLFLFIINERKVMDIVKALYDRLSVLY